MNGLNNRPREGFTLVELLIVVTLLSVVAFLMVPKLTERFSPPELLLQRALLNLNEMSSNYSGIRLTVGEDGSILAERRIIGEDDEPLWEKVEARWLSFKGKWKASPEYLYLFPDGTCTPWSLEYSENSDEAEKFFITVTATVYRD